MTREQAKTVRIGDSIRDRRNGRLLVVRNIVYTVAVGVPVSRFETVCGDIPTKCAEIVAPSPSCRDGAET